MPYILDIDKEVGLYADKIRKETEFQVVLTVKDGKALVVQTREDGAIRTDPGQVLLVGRIDDLSVIFERLVK